MAQIIDNREQVTLDCFGFELNSDGERLRHAKKMYVTVAKCESELPRDIGWIELQIEKKYGVEGFELLGASEVFSPSKEQLLTTC